MAVFRLSVSLPTLSAENAERMGHPSTPVDDQKERLGQSPEVNGSGRGRALYTMFGQQ